MSRRRTSPRYALLAAVLLVAGPGAVPAKAQDFQVQPVFDMGVLANTMTQGAATQQAARLGSQRAPISQTSPGSVAVSGLSPIFGGGAVAPAQAVPARLAYTPTPALRQQAASAYVGRIEQQNPEAARIVKQQLAQHDYGMIFRQHVKGSPLRDNDAADAVTAYTLLGWQIVNQAERAISDREVSAVRAQIAPALAANPQLSAPTTRAALGEEMKLLYVTLHAGWQGAAREGNKRQYSDGVARMWKNQTGRDLRAVKLTDAGFSRR